MVNFIIPVLLALLAAADAMKGKGASFCFCINKIRCYATFLGITFNYSMEDVIIIQMDR